MKLLFGIETEEPGLTAEEAKELELDEQPKPTRHHSGHHSPPLEQRTRIVFIDGTQSSVGFALNKLASNTNTNFDINKSLSDALTLYETDRNFISSIFAASAYDYNYRLASICLRIPVAKTEDGLAIDDSKLDSISVIN